MNLQSKLLVEYNGPCTINTLTYFGAIIRKMVKDNYCIQSKIFKVFIELAQNISIYSAERKTIDEGLEVGVGSFKIEEKREGFTINTSNLILEQHSDKLSQYCDEINSLDNAGLRKLKAERRSNRKAQDSGAHIGIIQTSILAENKIEYKIEKVNNNYSRFSISVLVEKQS